MNETPKPKPRGKKDTAKDGAIFDAVLDDATIEQHTDPVEEVVVVEAEVAPVVENQHSFAPPSEYAVVGLGAVDEVSLSKLVYKNLLSKKSLSVHHVQRRLNERGYSDAFLDKDGYYGDHTKSAMAQFQKDSNIEGDGMPDLVTLVALFENDNNVVVVA